MESNTSTVATSASLPYKARRIIGKYEPAIRAEIDRQLASCAEERGGIANLRLEDLGLCVSLALSAMANERFGPPKPDPRMVSLSLAAIKAGEGMSIEEYIDVRRKALADRARNQKDRRP